MTHKSPQEAIASNLAVAHVILVKQLSYLCDISIAESRQELTTFQNANSSSVLPIYLVSGLRLVHNQISYAFLFTTPQTLDMTKSKFQTIVAVQLHGIISSLSPDSTNDIPSLIAQAQNTITSGELQLLTQHPLLTDNSLRTNAYSNIINPQIQRQSNAYINVSKVTKSTDIYQGSLFDASNTTSTKITTQPIKNNTTTTQSTPATIVLKQNRLSFGANQTPTIPTDLPQSSGSGVKRASSSIFDQLDNDIPLPSNSTKFTKDKNPFASKTTSHLSKTAHSARSDPKIDPASISTRTAPPTKVNPFAAVPSASASASASTKPTVQSASLFDELDQDDFFTSSTSPSTSSKNKPKPTKVNHNAKKAAVVIDSESSGEDDDDFGGLGFNGAMVTMNDDDDNDDDDEDNLFDDEKKKTRKSKKNKTKSLIGGSSDSDNDMVRTAKGSSSTVAKAASKDTTKENKLQPASKRVVLDDDSDSDEYFRSVTKNRQDNIHSNEDIGFGTLSKEEIDKMEETQRIDAIKAQTVHNTNTHTSATKDMLQSTTRVNEETGKHQKLITKTKYVTEEDEEGFEIRKAVVIEEWIDYTPALSKTAHSTSIPVPSTTLDSKTTSKSAKKEEKPKPTSGSIMKFFGGPK